MTKKHPKKHRRESNGESSSNRPFPTLKKNQADDFGADDEQLDSTDEASFPASDSPSNSPVVGIGREHKNTQSSN